MNIGGKNNHYYLAKCTKTAYNNYYACSLSSKRLEKAVGVSNVGDAFSFAIYKTPSHISAILYASNINTNDSNVAHNNKRKRPPNKMVLKKRLDISKFLLKSGVSRAQYFT